MQDNGAFEEGMKNFFAILESLIGKRAVQIIRRKIESEARTKDPSKILFTAVSALTELIGRNGACAIVREIGREVAAKMMEGRPPSTWWSICQEALKEAGYAQQLEDLSEGDFCVVGCSFYPQFLKPNGLEASKHPICWIASGFIEEFARRVKGVKGIHFEFRDNEKNCCRFKYLDEKNILGGG